MATMPSGVSPHVGPFDRFAGAASRIVSRAWFFAACLLLVIVWAPSYWLIGDVNTWQLIINTATTIVTFLLVALLQNTQQRADQATQHKLNAIAAAHADLMGAMADDAATDYYIALKLRASTGELRAAVGLEDRESSTDG